MYTECLNLCNLCIHFLSFFVRTQEQAFASLKTHQVSNMALDAKLFDQLSNQVRLDSCMCSAYTA